VADTKHLPSLRGLCGLCVFKQNELQPNVSLYCKPFKSSRAARIFLSNELTKLCGVTRERSERSVSGSALAAGLNGTTVKQGAGRLAPFHTQASAITMLTAVNFSRCFAETHFFENAGRRGRGEVARLRRLSTYWWRDGGKLRKTNRRISIMLFSTDLCHSYFFVIPFFCQKNTTPTAISNNQADKFSNAILTPAKPPTDHSCGIRNTAPTAKLRALRGLCVKNSSG
jgi:hypothetical protein